MALGEAVNESAIEHRRRGHRPVWKLLRAEDFQINRIGGAESSRLATAEPSPFATGATR